MPKTYPLGPLSQIPAGEGRVFVVAGRKIAVFHDRSGQLYATQAECPHAQGPLADGLLGSGKLICPLHERIFDLASGNSLNSDCSLKVFTIQNNDDLGISLSI